MTTGALTPEAMFSLACDEAFKDGRLDEWEGKVLSSLARFLGLRSARARALADESRRAPRDPGAAAGPMDGRQLYRRVLERVVSDWEIDPVERRMLEAIRKLFRIEEGFHQQALDELRATYQKRGRDAAAQADPEPGPVRLEDLVAQALVVGRAAQAEALTAVDEALVPEVWRGLLDAFLADPGCQAQALSALVHLAPALVQMCREKKLETFLTEVAQAGGAGGEGSRSFRAACEAWLVHVVRTEDHGRIARVAGFCLDLVDHLPARAELVDHALALLRLTCTQAARAGLWEVHHRSFEIFAGLPAEFGVRQARAWARAAAEAVELVTAGGRWWAAPALASAAKGLGGAAQDAEVAGWLVEFWSRLAVAAAASEDNRVPTLEAAATHLADMVAEAHQRPEAWARGAAAALPVLASAGEVDAALRLARGGLEALGPGGHLGSARGDFAQGLVQAGARLGPIPRHGGTRPDRPLGPDRCRMGLRDALDALAEAAPEDPVVRACADRLERIQRG